MARSHVVTVLNLIWEDIPASTLYAFIYPANVITCYFFSALNSILRDPKEVIGTIIGNCVASLLTTIVVFYHRNHASWLAVIGYGLVGLSVFAFMEIAKPVTDFGLLQFFMRLPLQTSAAYIRFGQPWIAVLLIVVSSFLQLVGTIRQFYGLKSFNWDFENSKKQEI